MTQTNRRHSPQQGSEESPPDALETFRQAALQEFQRALAQTDPQEAWDRLTNIMREAALQAGAPVPVFTVIRRPHAGDILRDILIRAADRADHLRGIPQVPHRNRVTITQEQARQAAPDIDRAILKAILDLQPVMNTAQVNGVTTLEIADRALSRHLPSSQRYALIEISSAHRADSQEPQRD